ncbi:MAG: hypothetical protein KA974_06055 [Saprospiraceae bacterium]|nr:hypothetical protein [Saprospiraceae bacterium]MBP7699563.1 hypothetical protein [Saprospiraceae bacterium]
MMINTNDISTDFDNQSRVWVYQLDRTLSAEETETLTQALQKFTAEWTSHNRALKAAGHVHFGRFVVLMVDETLAGASGCSIDSSVHFLQNVGQQLKVNMFDRTTVAYWQHDQLAFCSLNQLTTAYKQQQVLDSTVVFNNLVQTKEQLLTQWQTPLAESWHKRFI